MDDTRLASFLGLPSEVLCRIVPLLSRHDLCICVQVCKAWHTAFMDSLWNTVELRDTCMYNKIRPFLNRIIELYGPHLVPPGCTGIAEETAPTRSPFLKNLYRIRAIDVQYTTFLNLFLDQGPLPLEEIPLEKLTVGFESSPGLPWRGSQLSESPEINSLLQILSRSTRLSSLSYVTVISCRAMKLGYQARLLANLPPSLERLSMSEVMGNRHRSIAAVSQEQSTEALDLFLEMKKDGVFENLTTLSIVGESVDLKLLGALLERSPRLEELGMDGRFSTWTDSALAEIVSSVPKGWKTLSFREISTKIGPLAVAAILNNCATLENIRLSDCNAFDSKAMQKLLCSAPNLRRFDTISSTTHNKLKPCVLVAMDVVESIEDWVCLGLESFKCHIGGVPRPYHTFISEPGPLTGNYNLGSPYSGLESTNLQRRVMAQLGRLTKLREITLGKDVVDGISHPSQINLEDMDDRYYALNDYHRGTQHHCLTMSLQDGLDELKDLKCLRRITLENMSLNMGEAEQKWMKENWPEYGMDSRDMFWTSRGHRVTIGLNLYHKKFRDNKEAQATTATYDWW